MPTPPIADDLTIPPGRLVGFGVLSADARSPQQAGSLGFLVAGAEFGSPFHRRVLDPGIGLVYIEPATPRLNGEFERPHRIDQDQDASVVGLVRMR